MNKHVLSFFFIVLLSSAVTADIDSTVSSFIIPDVCGDGLCTGLESCLSCPGDCGVCTVTGGGGGGSGAIYLPSRDDYMINVEIKNMLVTGVSLVEAKVTVFNTGQYEDDDVYLYSYMKAPDNKTYAENITFVGTVKPACKDGHYDRNNDICIYPNETEFEPNKYIFTYKNPIPKGTPIGKWRFYAELESKSTRRLVAWDEFELYTGILLAVILFGFVLILAFRRRKKKIAEKRKKKRRRRKR